MDILDALYNWLDTLLSTLYSTYYITTEYDTNISRIDELPWVSIRVEHESSTEVVYGRIRNSTVDKIIGNTYSFTIFCTAKRGTGTHPFEPVVTLSDHIINFLDKKNSDKSDMATHGIWYIGSISESHRRARARNAYTVEINGVIESLRKEVTTTSTSTSSTSTTSTTSTSTSTSTTSP